MATMEKKQQAVLRCLNTLISARGYSPTVAVLAQYVGKSRNATMFQLDRLVDRGYVKHEKVRDKTGVPTCV